MLTVEDIDIQIKKNKLKPTEIVVGESPNPELIGYAWADINSIPVKEFLVMWDDISNCDNVKINKWGKKYNPSAGFERNKKISEYSDAMLVFWDDTDNNSEHIISAMKKLGKPIYYAKPDCEYVF